MMIVTLSATTIMENGNWTGMWVFGLVGAVLAFLLVIVCVKAPAESERKDLEESAGAKENPEKHGVLWGYLAPLSLLSAVMFFLVGGATDAFNAFTIPFLNVENGWTEGAANLCATIAAVVMALFGGALMDRFGARKVVSIALLVSIVGNIAGLFWTSDAGILVTRALEGCGYGAAMTAGPGIIAMWYEPKKRGLANGVGGANVGFAMMIVTLSATPIMENGNWTGMWVFGLCLLYTSRCV